MCALCLLGGLLAKKMGTTATLRAKMTHARRRRMKREGKGRKGMLTNQMPGRSVGGSSSGRRCSNKHTDTQGALCPCRPVVFSQ